MRHVLLALSLVYLGCGDDNTGGDGGNPGDANTMGDLAGADLAGQDLVGADLAGADLSGGGGSDLVMTCGAVGAQCANGAGCCSGYCDPMALTCIPPPNVCGAQGAPCMSPTDCCSLTCTNGKCGTACVQNGANCAGNGDCCSGNCANGKCAAVVGGCTTDGNACNAPGDCCTSNCQVGVCVSAGGGCQVLGDVCFKGSDCCSGACSIPNGLAAGTCISINNGGCTLDGEVCPGCSTCCSRVCAPTITGGSVCTPAGGCRLQDDVCYQDSDCCGAPGSNLPGDGLVTCQIVQGTNPPVGFCSHPSGGGVCDPEGDVCGIKPPQACGGNAREDCCDCISPKFNCCKLDKSGVPRCYGGSTQMCPNGYTGQPPCCIMPGQQCTFSSECCNGAPCVPDNMGVLRCGSMCQQTGQVCTSNSDCCTGLPCIIPKGKLVGMCGNPPPPPPTDGGVPPDLAGTDLAGVDLAQPPGDMATCALVGQTCSTTIPCCNGATCENSTGTADCKQGDTNCSCFGIIM